METHVCAHKIYLFMKGTVRECCSADLKFTVRSVHRYYYAVQIYSFCGQLAQNQNS